MKLIRKSHESIIDSLTYVKKLFKEILEKNGYINVNINDIRILVNDKKECLLNLLNNQVDKSTQLPTNTNDVIYIYYRDICLNYGTISSTPCCCGMCILNNDSNGYNQNKKGYGRLGSFLRRIYAFHQGYTICTAQDKHNSHSINIIEKSGWSYIGEFKNYRTGNLIKMYNYDLDIFKEVDLEKLI